MKYSNSPLVVYTKLSPNCSKPRNHKIDTITIHSMAGDLTIETCGNIFASPSRKASSNYGIGSDGRIALYVDEANRSWCTSNAANDHRAITIEVANTTNKDPWPISDKAMESLIKLCADICSRNAIKELLWKGDKSLIGQVDKQNLTAHRWFAPKACLPIYTEVLGRKGWKKLSEVARNDLIATVDKDSFEVVFDVVQDIVEPREELIYNVTGIEVTADHRMLYNDHVKKVNVASEVFGNDNAIPYTAALQKSYGLDISVDQLELMSIILNRGEYIYKDNKLFSIQVISITKEELDHTCDVARALDCNCDLHDDGHMIEFTDKWLIKFCEDYIPEKELSWDLLGLNITQAQLLLKFPSWKYPLSDNNRDVLSAIACLNGIGVVDKASIPSIPDEGIMETVSCVSVRSGFIIIRQNGNTFITGNCPGDYIYERLGYIAKEVNKRITPSVITNTSYSDIENTIWAFFKDKGLNAFAIAGIMGNLYAESGLRSNNLQNAYETKLVMTDESYTKAVDNNTYRDFAIDRAGYGLAQWTSVNRKQALLEFSKAFNVSIGDLNMQLEFLWRELNEDYSRAFNVIKAATSIREASDEFLVKFERPANSGEVVKMQRASYGEKYYKAFATSSEEYLVKVNGKVNYHESPSVDSKVLGSISDNGVYTIIEEKVDTSRWGKLKSGAGWIDLNNTKKI